MSKKLSKREAALEAIRAAGAVNDQKAFARLYIESRINYGVAKKAFQEGARLAQFVKERDEKKPHDPRSCKWSGRKFLISNDKYRPFVVEGWIIESSAGFQYHPYSNGSPLPMIVATEIEAQRLALIFHKFENEEESDERS